MTKRTDKQGYRLDDQVGFLLRKASQRHTAIFGAEMIGDLTPRQFAALAKLDELGPTSQNLLGRETAMDAATMKGVAGRLIGRGLVMAEPDPQDKRRLTLSLTGEGERLIRDAIGHAEAITRATLEPLSAEERAVLLPLLQKLG
jgi:DNA-binding MarR family transcriptional regulator